MIATPTRPVDRNRERELSLFQLLRPGAIADPYPLYRRLREEDPVHWDPFLNSWVVTSYAECRTALQQFSASRTPTEEYLEARDLGVLKPYTQVMLRQLLFLDPPSHTRIRGLCSAAFTPGRMERMRDRLTGHAHALLDRVANLGAMDLVSDFARPFPALVLAELIGLPSQHAGDLLRWVSDVSELLGNFEHDPDTLDGLVGSVLELKSYLQGALSVHRANPGEGVLSTMLSAQVDGQPGLSEDEIVANVILMIGGGLEEPANLICAGMLSLLERPGTLEQIAADPAIVPSAVEELLRFNSPTQHTGRVAPRDLVLGDKAIRQGQAVTVVLAAANRDPLCFPEPDALDLRRENNRHLAFGWGAHYCLGAPLARLAGQIAFRVLTERLASVTLGEGRPRWREMATMRGLTSLPLRFQTREAVA